MSAPSRRAFLGLAQGAVAAATVAAIGLHSVGTAEAMPVTRVPGAANTPSDLITPAQFWGLRQVPAGDPPRDGGHRRHADVAGFAGGDADAAFAVGDNRVVGRGTGAIPCPGQPSSCLMAR